MKESNLTKDVWLLVKGQHPKTLLIVVIYVIERDSCFYGAVLIQDIVEQYFCCF